MGYFLIIVAEGRILGLHRVTPGGCVTEDQHFPMVLETL